MPALILSVAGLPETGKTRLLGIVKAALDNCDINSAFDNPALATKPMCQLSGMSDAQNSAMDLPPDTTVILQEVYLEPDGTVSPVRHVVNPLDLP